MNSNKGRFHFHLKVWTYDDISNVKKFKRNIYIRILKHDHRGRHYQERSGMVGEKQSEACFQEETPLDP